MKIERIQTDNFECRSTYILSNQCNNITDYYQVGFLIFYFAPTVICFKHKITQCQITMNDAKTVHEFQRNHLNDKCARELIVLISLVNKHSSPSPFGSSNNTQSGPANMAATATLWPVLISGNSGLFPAVALSRLTHDFVGIVPHSRNRSNDKFATFSWPWHSASSLSSHY